MFMSFLHMLNHFLLARVCSQSPLRLHFAAHGVQRPSKKVFNPYAWWISLYSSFALRHDEVSLIIWSVGWFFDFVVHNLNFRVFFENFRIKEPSVPSHWKISKLKITSNSVCVCFFFKFQRNGDSGSKFLWLIPLVFLEPWLWINTSSVIFWELLFKVS